MPTKGLGQRNRRFRATVTRTLRCRYLLYLPPEYGKGRERWPLVLFLHGAGERGDDLALVKRHGPPMLVDQGREFPFILVSPQCAEDEWWSVETLAALLDRIQGEYRVDKSRVYVTGLSMGGFGTWQLAMEYPNRFAAIAPVCGGGNNYRPSRLKDLPIWAFHGARDPIIPAIRSREMVRAIRKVGGTVKLTVYPNVGHNSWVKAYNNPALYKWLLKQKRRL